MNVNDSNARKASIIIRTLNEAKHLPDLLRAINTQECPDLDVEVVLVDSGSSDGTLTIAEEFGVKIVHIKKEDFSFGRSLNYGCSAATGDVLVMVSGHCIPASTTWLVELIHPLGYQGIAYTYGGQRGNEQSHYSERRIFQKYFPQEDHLPQEGFYCNNANSAILKSVWKKYLYDEDMTGLEDMQLAKRMVADGHKVGYISSAEVFHLHDETWTQIRRRFEREAIALQYIMPEVHLGFIDVCHYFLRATIRDLILAYKDHVFLKAAMDILMYRFMQFTGSYRGNHIHRKLSRQAKDRYFYPNRNAQH